MASGKLLITRRQCQLFSMSMDNVIKVWDLRTNKCTQTITQDEWPQSEDAQPHSMVYDTGRKRLITASRRPFMWEHKLIMKDRTGHRSACVKAVYNSIFFVVVSVDDSASPLLCMLLSLRCNSHCARAPSLPYAPVELTLAHLAARLNMAPVDTIENIEVGMC